YGMKCKNYLCICVLLLPVWLSSCKDRFPPDAEEFFSFYADGEFCYYPQEEGYSFVGSRRALTAGNHGTAIYGIDASYEKEHLAPPGYFSFRFSNSLMPDHDTIIIDGNTTTVEIRDMYSYDNNYKLAYPLK